MSRLLRVGFELRQAGWRPCDALQRASAVVRRPACSHHDATNLLTSRRHEPLCARLSNVCYQIHIADTDTKPGMHNNFEAVWAGAAPQAGGTKGGGCVPSMSVKP